LRALWSFFLQLHAVALPSYLRGSFKVDKKSYAYTHYLITDEPRVGIVRPDGVVGAIAAGSSGVQKYFGLIQGH